MYNIDPLLGQIWIAPTRRDGARRCSAHYTFNEANNTGITITLRGLSKIVADRWADRKYVSVK